jgi:hypothetical protein
MKFAVSLLLFVLLGIAAGGCSDDPPSLRVRNDYSKKANLQFKPAGAATFNVNDVEAGAVREYGEIGEVEHQVSATIQSESAAPAAVFTAKSNYTYTVVVTNTTPPTLRVDAEEK